MNHMQQPQVQDEFCSLNCPYVATPPFMHVTCHALLAIRSGLHFTKLAIDSYLALYVPIITTPFRAYMQNFNSVVNMPLRSYLHHMLAE